MSAPLIGYVAAGAAREYAAAASRRIVASSVTTLRARINDAIKAQDAAVAAVVARREEISELLAELSSLTDDDETARFLGSDGDIDSITHWRETA